MKAAGRGAQLPSVTNWALWRLPLGLRWYVCVLIAAVGAVAGSTAALTSWRTNDVVLFGLLAAFGAVAVECTRRTAEPEPAGHIKEVYLAAGWLPVAVLLPPIYSLVAPVATFTLLQVRTRYTIIHRRVFSAAANGLALAAASAAFHALPVPSNQPSAWLVAATGCAVLWSAVSQALIIAAIRLSDPTVSIRGQLFTRTALANDACEIAGGLVVAGAITRIGLILLIPALPLVVILQRSFRHVQLQGEVRLDAQTDLLTAATWRAEAGVQLARAQRTGSPLAVGIIHLDSSSQSPDDEVRARQAQAVVVAAAAVIQSGLRPYDLIGRLGASEIIFLLPATTAGEAQQIAGRLRNNLIEHPITAAPGQPLVQVAAVLGIATTDDPAEVDLDDLMRRADVALHKARQSGQDHVCLASAKARSDHPSLDAQAVESGDEREEIATARRALGGQLSAARARAQLTQLELGRRVKYSRTSVASAESGHPYSAAFWSACDRALGAEGSLIAGHARIEAKVTSVRSRAAKEAWRARAETAEPGMAGGVPDGAVALDGSACPSCGEPLTGLVVTARVTAVISQHLGTRSPS